MYAKRYFEKMKNHVSFQPLSYTGTALFTIRFMPSHAALNFTTGCNFYCQARVPDPSRLLVSVGLGFFLEMRLPEALAFVEKSDGRLAAEAAGLTKQAATIKARVKLVIGGLQELQNIRGEGPRPPIRDIFA
jgi:prefoldin subunit 5